MRKRENLGAKLLFLFFFLLLCSVEALAEGVDLDISYGYQNTAKAGRFLPVSVKLRNTDAEDFTGMLRIYMAESEKTVCEYQYPSALPGNGSGTMKTTLFLPSGISQLYVSVEDTEGRRLGGKRIGLDVSGSDAELIVGVLSEHPENLSYLSGVSMNDGLLRTKAVNLDPDELPTRRDELSELDVLVISNYDMSSMREREELAIEQWVRNGGTLLIGTGGRGNTALAPYFDSYLVKDLSPQPETLDMGAHFSEDSSESADLSLNFSPVSLKEGRELISSPKGSVVSGLPLGSGSLSVAGYDLSDLQRFATEKSEYVDRLLSTVVGRTKLSELSTPASELSLRRYWSIDAVLNRADSSKRPSLVLYGIFLLLYVLLLGPGIFLFCRSHREMRLYRPYLYLFSGVSCIILFILSSPTRFRGPFLDYARIQEIHEQSVEETNFANLRSPYRSAYSVTLPTDYSIYPVRKGSDYSGDLETMLERNDYAKTTISLGRSSHEIQIRGESPFAANYFEIDQRLSKEGNWISGNVQYSAGLLSGTVRNETEQPVYDAALLFYGKLIRIGKIDAGQSLSLDAFSTENVPVGESSYIANRITSSRGNALLAYDLEARLPGYFPEVRFFGFVREENPSFIMSEMEKQGVTLVTTTLPLSTTNGSSYEFPAMEREVSVEAGNFDLRDNTISGMVPVVLSYHMKENERVGQISFDSFTAPDQASQSALTIHPFRGSISLYNYDTGGYDEISGNGSIPEGEGLKSYLRGSNILRVRYLSGEDQSLTERAYLPVLRIVAQKSGGSQ